MKHILSILFFLMSLKVHSSPVTCTEKVALTVENVRSVDLNIGEKTFLFSGHGNTTYITEKKLGFFSIEMFMADREQRLYSEGIMTKSDGLNLAIWARDALIEIECVSSSK